jgi:hypothetical protein
MQDSDPPIEAEEIKAAAQVLSLTTNGQFVLHRLVDVVDVSNQLSDLEQHAVLALLGGAFTRWADLARIEVRDAILAQR